MYKMIPVFLTLFSMINAQLQLPGSQTDEHNCVVDGGYQWCETTQKCQRPWEEDCFIDVDYCSISNIQTCRIACDIPQCTQDQCAMRIENCCDYVCSSNNYIPQCDQECPMVPCPMPEIMPNCRSVQNNMIDSCGCTTGCPTIDCSTKHNIVGEGESCGGFMPYGMAGICDDGYECVNTMGPMVADAPGTCQPICNTFRDYWGNCVDTTCEIWYDGCNTCNINKFSVTDCTENICYEKNEGFHCIDQTNTETNIPRNCVSWYDGCNTCEVDNGDISSCTLMYCFTQNIPYCISFSNDNLAVGDTCYRFCEDMSQTFIDLRDKCPEGSSCISQNLDEISFDTCNGRAYRCIPSNGH